MKILPEVCRSVRRPSSMKVGLGRRIGTWPSIRVLAYRAAYRLLSFTSEPRTRVSPEIRTALIAFSRRVLACLHVLTVLQVLVPRPAAAGDPEWISKYVPSGL